VKATIDASKLYEESVPEENKAKMPELEDEARQMRWFKEDEEVEEQLGSFIPNLGCTRSRNSIFFQTLELYWHTKTLVAIGILPKEQDFRHLKSKQEALEIQCDYVSEVVTWLANRKGGKSTPPSRNYVEAGSSHAAKGPVIVDLTSLHHIK
jgi:hypothetical protein